MTTGRGYKKMVEQVGALYREKSGKPLTEMYGGAIGPILEQIKAGSGASVVVSDKATLEASDVPFASFQPLGEAVLVLAWKKGIDIKSVDDLRTPAVQSIGYPDKQTAIYGKAAFSLLNKSGMYKELEPKLSMLSTVPRLFLSADRGLGRGLRQPGRSQPAERCRRRLDGGKRRLRSALPGGGRGQRP